MRLGVSPAATSTPTGVFNQRFEALFPRAGALACAVCFAPPPFLPVYLCTNVGLQGLLSCALPAPFVPQSATSLGMAVLAQVLSAWLPISAPPTGLDECFFFIFLVLGLSYSSIFCQSWLFFVFKLLLSFFWLCEEAQCVYLCLHLGQNTLLFLNGQKISLLFYSQSHPTQPLICSITTDEFCLCPV